MLEYLIHSVTCCDEIWEGQGGPVERKNISFPLKQKACCKLLLVSCYAVQLLCYVETDTTHAAPPGPQLGYC